MTHEIRRDFYDVKRVAPGVTTDTVGPAINGSTGAQNQYIIDGLKTLRSRRFGVGGGNQEGCADDPCRPRRTVGRSAMLVSPHQGSNGFTTTLPA